MTYVLHNPACVAKATPGLGSEAEEGGAVGLGMRPGALKLGALVSRLE